ncbi:cytochrome P450 [Streptomyces rimosus]|uniref:cytochrome P450 n=1 Tax=Streptomyces rimosus TaxID=1927 RepID=UPI0004C52981|nr:cytochrome P450 [Streptomyces rimosus]
MTLTDWRDEDILKMPRDFPPGPLFTMPPVFTELQDSRRLCPVEMPSGDRLWLVTRYEDVRFVLHDPRFSRDLVFPGAPRMAGEDLTSVDGSLFNTEGDRHARLRGVVSSYFTRGMADQWGSLMRGYANVLLDHMVGNGRSDDLISAFSVPLIARFARALMGLSGQEYAWVQRSIRQQLDLSGDQAQIAGRTAAVSQLAERLLSRAQADADAAPGLVMTLVQATHEGRMTWQEAVGTTGFLLMNVTEPLLPPLTVGVMTLLLHPEQLAECRCDPRLWPEAVREVLRYHNNAITNFPRVVQEDLEYGGTRIARGEGILTSALAAAHDPRAYADPGTFTIHRREKTSIYFGASSHFCLGAALVPVVLAAAYEVLFTRLGALRLAVEEHQVRMADDSFFPCPAHLPVAW